MQRVIPNSFDTQWLSRQSSLQEDLFAKLFHIFKYILRKLAQVEVPSDSLHESPVFARELALSPNAMNSRNDFCGSRFKTELHVTEIFVQVRNPKLSSKDRLEKRF